MAARPPSMKPKRWIPSEGNTQLHISCYEGDYNATLMLLLANADINARNEEGQTPLHHCTSQGHLEVMMLLLDSRADVNAHDKECLSPLHQALIHGNRHATELLLCYGAHIHHHDDTSSCNDEHVRSPNSTMSPLEFCSHVTICEDLVKGAEGHVWSLQHFCRLSIRKHLGVSKRRRIKELPLPRHLISYLISLPVSCSETLHANWERTRTTKCKLVKDKQDSRRPKRGGVGGVLQTLRSDALL